MAKRDTAVRLVDRYALKDLEPDVDPEKAAEYLAGGATKAGRIDSAAEQKPPPKSKPKPKSKTSDMAETNGRARAGAAPEKQPVRADVWTSRTIRLRQSTADALTMAACMQKTKQVEGKLRPSESVTVQEIAEQGIRLALIELGYLKK